MNFIPQLSRTVVTEQTRDWTPLFGEAPERPAFDRFNPPNWLGQENPFTLARPPVAFLLKLWNYDPELRVMPGISACLYRIARRTRTQLIRTALFGNDSETGRMCRERVVAVVSFIPTVVWNDDVIQYFADRDTWRHTNAWRDVADCVEEVERAEEDRKQRDSDDDGDVRGRAAWQALKLRTGQKVFVHEPSWSLNEVAGEAVAHGPQIGDTSHGSLPSERPPGQAEDIR